jgi:hypothetical protein
VLRDGRFSSASDVWAYGVVMWEVFANGARPYASMPSNALVRDRVLQGGRLEQPRGCSEHVYRLMLWCWSEHAAQRPTFAQVHGAMEEAAQQEQRQSQRQSAWYGAAAHATPVVYDEY